MYIIVFQYRSTIAKENTYGSIRYAYTYITVQCGRNKENFSRVENQ